MKKKTQEYIRYYWLFTDSEKAPMILEKMKRIVDSVFMRQVNVSISKKNKPEPCYEIKIKSSAKSPTPEMASMFIAGYTTASEVWAIEERFLSGKI